MAAAYEIVSLGDPSVDEGDKVWFAMPGRGGKPWCLLGPCEPDDVPTDEAMYERFSRLGYNGMVFFKMAAPEEGAALSQAKEELNEMNERRRQQADEAFKAKQAESQGTE